MSKYIAFLLLLCIIPNSVSAFSVEHDFNVRLGVFNASDTTFTYALSPNDYAVSSKVATAGLFDTLYPFKAIYSTTGKIKANELETTSYKYESQSRFTKRTKELVYGNDGLPLYRISSKNDKEKKVEIKNDLNNKDTTDLQTVFAKLAKQYNSLKFCDSRMEVFDGKRRFSVIFKDEGKENISLTGDLKIQGEAAKCSMYIDKLNSKDDDLLWELTSQHPVYFWIMEHPKHKVPFIAKIEVEDTPLGKLEVYSQNIKIKE